jgi:hypothetical protein
VEESEKRSSGKTKRRGIYNFGHGTDASSKNMSNMATQTVIQKGFDAGINLYRLYPYTTMPKIFPLTSSNDR